MKQFFILLEIMLVLLLGGSLFFVYSGRYNVSALAPEQGVLGWLLETTMENSVRRQARDIKVPDLAAVDQREGLHHYREMCVLCHGAPGRTTTEIGKGMNPGPPNLAMVVQGWSPAELFWIISNGVKMSGMPGFGPTHQEEELWAIVAFIRTLPNLSPSDYQNLLHLLPQRGDPGENRGQEQAPGGSPEVKPSPGEGKNEDPALAGRRKYHAG